MKSTKNTLVTGVILTITLFTTSLQMIAMNYKAKNQMEQTFIDATLHSIQSHKNIIERCKKNLMDPNNKSKQNASETIDRLIEKIEQ